MFKTSAVTSAITTMLLGLSVVIGWLVGSEYLIQVNSEFVPMQFNTALGFILAGIGLGAVIFDYTKSAISSGIALMVLGMVTFLQYPLGLNFGMDEFFLNHYIVIESGDPGRMAPNTALGFFLSGLSFWYIARHPHDRAMHVSNILGTLLLFLGGTAFLGYAAQLSPGYNWGLGYNSMALHTSAGFMVIGFGIIQYLLSETQKLREAELKAYYQKIHQFNGMLQPEWSKETSRQISEQLDTLSHKLDDLISGDGD